MKKVELVNVIERNRKHPKTFKIPNMAEIESIKEGSYVKVLAPPERFWCKVLEMSNEGVLKVVIEQSDIFHSAKHGYKDEDNLEVRAQHICGIYNK